ncbi:MAG: ABC transporter ATP-binding protein [bacterium]|nr:ABC transporter ATP-binding protein [bacterium]
MIIDVENLSKVYRKNFKNTHALRNINFKVPKNIILGILGPNGAGKTTLLKILTGITQPGPDASIQILGTDDIQTVKYRIGFLPENPEFLKNITAAEFLRFSASISNTTPTEKEVEDLLQKVNLLQEKNERVKNFSKGMRQRIGIAQAIIHSPELLVLDEPMSGLDPPGRRMVIDIIRDYFAQGKTILFSTHNLDDIEALCTDVLVLKQGEIQLQKELSKLRLNCRYKIEAETDDKKWTEEAENEADLWNTLETIKSEKGRIIKIQSGIARQLEKYYEI